MIEKVRITIDLEAEYVTPDTLGVAIRRIYDVAESIAQKGDVNVVVNVGETNSSLDAKAIV